jgi:putative Holliday junction resolvase
MRVLALDIGQARIGVAVSDPDQILARSLKVIHRSSRQRDFAVIGRLVRELGVEKVIVGHPLSLDGTVGRQARRVERYTVALAESLDVPVVLRDERFSTAEARQLMIEAGHKRKTRRQKIDAVAAAVLLQDYLDEQRAASKVRGT